jgi:glycosyltransferase involved in cell wall biosynthesis
MRKKRLFKIPGKHTKGVVMRIGIIIGRIGDVDGVSLETEKWITVLKEMGHEIYLLSGRYRKSILGKEYETLMPGLSFFSPECEWEQDRAFFYPPDDPSELLEHLHRVSDGWAIRMFKWVMLNKIEVIVSENASALPSHLSMGMAIKKLVEHTGVRIICHDHDFYWERGKRYVTPFPEVEKIMKETFPLQIPHAKHAVINSPSKKALKERFGMNGVIVVPNVMDFDQPYGEVDEYNKDLLKSLGIGKRDIPLFQVTRIVERKGIETALELLERFEDERIKLVITGSAKDDERKGYYKTLIRIINKKKLNGRAIFAHQRILNDRGTTPQGEKIFNLSDAYAHATASTYFSKYEGFGNAFLEAVLSKTPIFVNNYPPVYWPDIGSKGFKTVMLENNKLTDEAVAEATKILHNKKLQKEIVEHNYNLGKYLFSFDVLREKLEILFEII